MGAVGQAARRLRDSYYIFLALPREVYIVLIIDFLNSYRSFGFRSVQYLYITKEYGVGDIEAGTMLGINAWLQVVFGLLGALLTDRFGVRRTAIMALSVAVVARGILTFSRTKAWLKVAILVLTPFGEAVLGTGIYTVALKKLTTPATRGLVFGVQYGVFNFSGALADIIADRLRQRSEIIMFGMQWSGLRVHVFGTWLAVVMAWLVSIRFLFDVTVKDIVSPSSPCSPVSVRARGDVWGSGEGDESHFEILEEVDIVQNAPRCSTQSDGKQSVLARSDPHGGREGAPALSVLPGFRRNSLPGPRGVVQLTRSRRFWRALCLSLCLFWISAQWADADQLMPPFLERYYGEGVPIYTIHSINMWICMFGPWIVAPLTSHMEAFGVMLPGLWIMGLSPVFLVLWPTVPSAILWVFFMSLGEIFWSPRQSAWTASLAPEGHEAIFLALLSLKSLITAVPSTAFNGWLNAKYNQNCLQCRDDLGHFCSVRTACEDAHARPASLVLNATLYEGLDEVACVAGGAVCRSATGNLCSAPELFVPSFSEELLCPETCRQCPGWIGNAEYMWAAVLFLSVLSPVLVTIFLPFLRGDTWRCFGRTICEAADPDDLSDDDASSPRYEQL